MVDTMGGTAKYDETAIWYKSSEMRDGREEGGAEVSILSIYI